MATFLIRSQNLIQIKKWERGGVEGEMEWVDELMKEISERKIDLQIIFLKKWLKYQEENYISKREFNESKKGIVNKDN